MAARAVAAETTATTHGTIYRGVRPPHRLRPGRDLEAIATAAEGTRNQALFCKARALSRFDIPRADLAQDLLNAARAAGLPDWEATATINSAFRSRSAS
jgi:hypothetical protein